MYLKDGLKIHPRQTRQLFSPNDERMTVRPTLEQMRLNNILHFKGRQYRYFYFLCDKKEQKKWMAEYQMDLNLNRPKDKDLVWEVRNNTNGRWYISEKPPYQTDMDDVKEIQIAKNTEVYEQLSLF